VKKAASPAAHSSTSQGFQNQRMQLADHQASSSTVASSGASVRVRIAAQQDEAAFSAMTPQQAPTPRAAWQASDRAR
jgi:hypothetical protein